MAKAGESDAEYARRIHDIPEEKKDDGDGTLIEATPVVHGENVFGDDMWVQYSITVPPGMKEGMNPQSHSISLNLSLYHTHRRYHVCSSSRPSDTSANSSQLFSRLNFSDSCSQWNL